MNEIGYVSMNQPSCARGSWREVFLVAYPLILSSFSATLMHFVDRLYLSWYDTRTIAAAMPGGILSFTMVCLFMGTARFTNTFVAQFYGAKDYERCAAATWQGVYFALFAAVLIPLTRPLGERILTWGNHSAEIQAMERLYFRILLYGGGLEVLNAAFSSFYTGRGKTLVVLWVTLIANAANAVLDYAMVFGRLGFPEMGIKGAALATVICSAIPCVIFMVLMLGRENRRLYATTRFVFRKDLFWNLIRYGVPSGFNLFLDISSFTLFVILVGRLGESQLAASNIALSINTLSFFPILGISIATSTVVGQCIGARDIRAAQRTPYSALRLALTYAGVFALLFGCAPDAFFRLFAQRSEGGIAFETVARHGRYLMRLVALYGLFDALNLTFCGALKGAGDTRFAMWVGLIGSWLFFVPCVYVLIHFFQANLLAVWGCMTIYAISLGVAYFVRFRMGQWKSIDLIEH